MTKRQHATAGTKRPSRVHTPAGQAIRKEYGHLLLATIAINLLSLALPIMTLQVYDRVLPNPDSGTLPVLMIGVCVAIACETCLRLARAWMMGWGGAVYEHHLSTQAMQHILHADVARSKQTGIGEFLHRLTAIGRIKDFENGYVLVTITELAFIPVFLAMIVYIAPTLALVPLGLLALFVGVSVFQGRKLQTALDLREKADDRRYDYLIECLKGIHTLKSFALESLFSRRYEYLQEKSGLASFHTAEASTVAFNFGTMISHLMMVAVMTAGALAAIAGHVTTGALIATLLLSGRLMQPAQRGLSLWTRYQDVTLARRKVNEIFSMPQLKTTEPQNLPAPAGYMTVRQLHFGNKLQNISFDLVPGDVISIRGRSGAGKTTLLEMLAGLYPPDKGEILTDGHDMRHYPPEELSRHVGYIATDGVIFHGTIRDNMTRFGTINESAAQEIARRLQIDRDVALLPSGFDTMLHPQGGDQVPPGLRQRIAMTRILASHPKIILFDEADRALDREGYTLVFSLLAQISRHTAMVLISDDANITALARKHYILEDGHLRTASAADMPTRKAAS